KKTLIIVLLVLSVLAAMVIYRINSNKEKDAKNSGPRAGGRGAAKVYGKVIEGQEFSDFLTLSGSIEADEQIELHTEISGIVESINFSEGGRVGQGQVLVTLNDAE